MIRIVTAEDPACIRITVDGDLWGDGLAEVEICCNQATSKGKPVRLFLRDVPVLGEDGCRLLCRLAAKGIELKATGVYNSYIVDSILSDDRRMRLAAHESTRDVAGRRSPGSTRKVKKSATEPTLQRTAQYLATYRPEPRRRGGDKRGSIRGGRGG